MISLSHTAVYFIDAIISWHPLWFGQEVYIEQKKTENKYHDVHSEHNVVSSTNMTALFIMQESLGVSMLEVKWVAHGTWWHFQ